MLSVNSLNQASTLASKLADSGLMAIPKPNTALNELVSLSNIPYDMPLETEENIQEAFLMLESMTRYTVDGNNPHCLEQDALVKDLSSIVTNHVSFAKNTVKPFVIEFVQGIKEYLDIYQPKTASEQFDIQILDVPEVLVDESFLDTLSVYKGKTVISPDLKFKLEVKTTEEILSLLTFGYERIDKMILEWVSTKDEDFILRIYNSFFTSDAKDKANLSYDSIERCNVFDKADYALAIFLMARKLFDNVDESATNTDLSTYRNTAAEYRDYAGALLVACINNIAMLNSTNILIIESLPSNYIIKVNGSIYRPWLQNGGSPEVILGYTLSPDTNSSLPSIDSNSKNYLDKWNSFVTFYNVDQVNKSFNLFKEFLLSSFAISMKELTEQENEYVTKNPNYYEIVNKTVNEIVDGLKRDDMKDYYNIALCMVAKGRFYYTSAYNILNDFTEAAKANPNVDVREAALLAVINYITDYFVNQISFVDDK